MSLPLNPLRRATCLRCQSFPRFSHAGPTRLFSTSPRNLNSSEGESSDQRINTWFLSQPSRPLPPSSINPPTSSTSAQLDPSSYRPQPIHPIPETTPPILHPLHAFLTSPSSEASEVLHAHTVRMYDTSSLFHLLDQRGQGDLVGTEEGRVGWYDWVITLQVKGRGRGVVGRGDGVLRRWLLKNPLHPSIPPSPHEYPKTPRIPPDSDWSIVPLNLGPEADIRACVNLLSEEGVGRWKLDELWEGR
ncbi:hypothetical protein I302_102332 [Kwoniella bestiolae CBS 10118]|uniref:Uncharacterized protein n=1 Tax=Kwoniella bestiolae CBS 10118 TaxID=1296100 RepID=A0A1B9GEX2_9TREE|nr:hypothetical protein I302_01025 [Kwoniella bestiolae CBS 10118]OCF29518.1 hypothetical protein I302_01025 [Kwoniella bestiolae CBS 10118]